MPIYEYECDCGESKEVFWLKMEEKNKVLCEKCNKEMKRVLSRGNFVLKGGCWYSDGYSKGAKK